MKRELTWNSTRNIYYKTPRGRVCFDKATWIFLPWVTKLVLVPIHIFARRSSRHHCFITPGIDQYMIRKCLCGRAEGSCTPSKRVYPKCECIVAVCLWMQHSMKWMQHSMKWQKSRAQKRRNLAQHGKSWIMAFTNQITHRTIKRPFRVIVALNVHHALILW